MTSTLALDSPLTLRSSITLPNRLAKAATSECLGDLRHGPSGELVRLYERLAAGGAGLLVTGNVMVDRTALGEAGNVVVTDRRHLARLRSWSAAARSHGAVALAQLNHPGRQVLRGLGMRPVAPSPVRVVGGGLFRTPTELTDSQVWQIIDRFATSAAVMVDGGFDGVQLHAAHGYLVSQFLSPLTNRRNDRWGGDAARRSRFLLELVDATRAAIGDDRALSVKINSADFQRGGFAETDALRVVSELDRTTVDLIEISGGTYESTAFMGVTQEDRAPSTIDREAYFLDFAASVAGRLTTPLMVTGGFRTGPGMTDALTSGALDVIGLARPVIVDPTFPRRVLAGEDVESAVLPRRLGVRHVDGLVDLTWHTTQLQRMGRGHEPRLDAHPLRTLAAYSRRLVPYTAARLTGVGR